MCARPSVRPWRSIGDKSLRRIIMKSAAELCTKSRSTKHDARGRRLSGSHAFVRGVNELLARALFIDRFGWNSAQES